MKTTQKYIALLFLVGLAMVLFACKKHYDYEEGPKYNMFIKDKDIAGRWEIEEAYRDGADITSLFNDSSKFVFSFSYYQRYNDKSGKYEWIFTLIPGINIENAFLPLVETTNPFVKNLYFWNDPNIFCSFIISDKTEFYKYRNRWRPFFTNLTLTIKILYRDKKKMKWELMFDEIQFIYVLNKIKDY